MSLSSITLHLQSVQSTCIISTTPSEASLVPCQSRVSTLPCFFQAFCDYFDPIIIATCMSPSARELLEGRELSFMYHGHYSVPGMGKWMNGWEEGRGRKRE